MIYIIPVLVIYNKKKYLKKFAGLAKENNSPDLHHLQGVWDLPRKFPLYLIVIYVLNFLFRGGLKTGEKAYLSKEFPTIWRRDYSDDSDDSDDSKAGH